MAKKKGWISSNTQGPTTQPLILIDANMLVDMSKLGWMRIARKSNSLVTIDGLPVCSVPGRTLSPHRICTLDHSCTLNPMSETQNSSIPLHASVLRHCMVGRSVWKTISLTLTDMRRHQCFILPLNSRNHNLSADNIPVLASC